MIGFDLPLLFVLVIRSVDLFSLPTSVYLYVLPHQQLVFWIFSFALLGIYVWLTMSGPKQFLFTFRLLVISTLGLFLIGSLLGIQLAVRHATDRALYTHDGAVQTEDAIAAFKSGENPYAIDYQSRTFGSFPDVFSEATRPNPAWSHFIYLPLPVVLGAPLSAAVEHLGGWFDLRYLYTLAFILLVAAGALLARDHEQRILSLIFLLFNPFFTQFFVGGFNDVFFLGWIALSMLLLQRGRFGWSAVALGLAVASKQSAWLLIPFMLIHVFMASRQQFGLTWRRLWPGVVTALAIILPFFLWSPSAFIDDTVRYASGGATLSYPISGFGLGQLLLSMGVVRSMWDRYPFWIIQLIVCLPLLFALLRWQRRDPTISRMLLSYGVFAFAFWWTSRFFNDSYIGVISVIFTLAFAARDYHRKTA